MTTNDKRRVAEFEADIKNMMRDHEDTFRVFEDMPRAAPVPDMTSGEQEPKKPSGLSAFFRWLLGKK